MKIAALLLLILTGSGEPRVNAKIYPGTMSQCLDFVTERAYPDRIKVYCIPYTEQGAEFPVHVLRALNGLPIAKDAPLRIDDVPMVPKG